jgi:hypothetical protein
MGEPIILKAESGPCLRGTALLAGWEERVSGIRTQAPPRFSRKGGGL